MDQTKPIELVENLFETYYHNRDIDGVISLVTNDVCWIGTEEQDVINGIEELKNWLKNNIKRYPKPFHFKIYKKSCESICENLVTVKIKGVHMTSEQIEHSFQIRGTILCIKINEQWKIKSLHISTPNSNFIKKTLSQELEETRRKEAVLVSSIVGGVAIYRIKKEGRVATEYISDGLAKMLGYETKEFLKIIEYDAVKNLVPQDVPKVMLHLKKSIEAGKPIDVVYRVYNKDKQSVRIRLSAVIMNENIKDDEIAVIYAVHTRVSSEYEQILKEQQRYHEILNNLDVAYFEWVEDGRFEYSEKYKNYILSEVNPKKIGKNEGTLQTIHPDDVGLLKEAFIGCKRKEPKISVTLRCKMKDGSYRWTEMIEFFEYSQTGKITRKVGIFQDVENDWRDQNERLQKALEEAKHANKAKTEFLSTVSHDMRTPLNGILGITHILLNNEKDENKISDLAKLDNSGKYLLSLINDTLDVSRIESGKMELHPAVWDNNHTIKSTLDVLKPNLEGKKIKLDLHISQLPYTQVFVDINRVEQLVINVVSNAIKFSPEGGTIGIYMKNISVKNGIIKDEIIIKDYGVGMSKEFIPYIFDPFAQENQNSTTAYKGTGLGMSICKKIVELMNGEISVESELGVGTSVRMVICIPIATEEQIREHQFAANKLIDKIDLAGKRVLLCDDQKLNSEIAARILAEKGIISEMAMDGKEGVEKFTKSEVGYYDAIFMDIRMPVMDGLEATERIRESSHPQGKTIPIIAMTANAFKADVENCLNKGMNAHISKPIDTKKVFQVLSHEIGKK